MHGFWRASNRDWSEYAGCANAVKVFNGTSPVEIPRSFAEAVNEAEFFVGPDEIPSIGYRKELLTGCR